jgi:hypothetical protein
MTLEMRYSVLTPLLIMELPGPRTPAAEPLSFLEQDFTMHKYTSYKKRKLREQQQEGL